MKTVWNWIQVALAAIGGGLGWFFGEMDGFFYALIAFVVIDYPTGVMCAIIDKTLSSNVGFKGIFRKVLIFVMVGIGHVIDTQLIGSGDALRTAVIFFYISNEGVSLLENAGHIGLPIPEKLKEVLAQLHNRTEDDKDTEDSVLVYTQLAQLGFFFFFPCEPLFFSFGLVVSHKKTPPCNLNVLGSDCMEAGNGNDTTQVGK